MSLGKIERTNAKDIEESLTEVEFALVLSRIIASVDSDPEQLRQTIYDLARYKLRDQLEQAGSSEQNHKSIKALEVAIQGVEAFSRQKQVIGPVPGHHALGSSTSNA